jgi:hypothetical protein
MPAPVLSSFAADVYASLAPLADDVDAQNQWALANYVQAIGRMFQIVDDYGRDTAAGPGWSNLMDVNRCPPGGLPWLGQLIGVVPDSKLTVQQQRDKIKAADGWHRGTPDAFVAAAQLYLTGSKQVILRERFGGPWKLSVVTRTSETPDAAKVLAEMLKQKPAGITLTHTVLNGQDYQQLLTVRSLYSTVFTTYTTYQGVVSDTPGT